MRRKSQSGDTIVEVLIATAIIGLVMTVSFATTQRSVLVGRRAQERTEGLKIAESQIEILKSLAPSASQDIFAPSLAFPSRFCVNPSGIQLVAAGMVCNAGPENRYQFIIEREDDTSATGFGQSTFYVSVEWDRVGGGRDEIQLVYRIHRGQYNK